METGVETLSPLSESAAVRLPEATRSLSVVALRRHVTQLMASDFLRKVAETYVTQVVLLGLSLLTSITVARTLGPEGRGLYAVAMALGLAGVQLGNLGLHASNTYYVAKDHKLLPTLLGNSLVISLGLGGGLAMIGNLVFESWPRVAPLQGRLVWLGLAWIPIGLAFLLMENLLLGLQHVRSYNLVELLNRVLALVLVCVVILGHHTSPDTVFVAMLIALTLSAAWTFYLVLRVSDGFPWPSARVLAAHFRLRIKAYLIAFFGFLLLRIDLFMVKYLLGAEQAGYYSIASTMADYVLVLPSVIGLILFPRLSSLKDHEEKFCQAMKAAKGTAFALMPLLMVASVAAQPIVATLFGKAFLPAAAAFLWLVPGLFVMGVETTLVQFLNSLGYPIGIVWLWFSATVLNVLLNLWLIPTFGIVGASVASTVCYSLVFIVVFVMVRARGRAHRQLVVA